MHFSLHCPETVEQAIALRNEKGGRYISGGTVLLVNRHQGKDIGSELISLEKIKGLDRIELINGVLTIGANVTFDMLESSDIVKKYAYALWQAAREVGGPQIRNCATLGGNIACASPASDSVPPLMALGAKVNVMGENGGRSIPVSELYTGKFSTVLTDDEIIVSVSVPANENSVSRFIKVGKRSALSVSCVNMAVSYDGKRVYVSVGAAAPSVVLCEKTSMILTNDIEAVDEARETVVNEISPIDDRWATASYRKTVCANLLKELLKEIKEAM